MSASLSGHPGPDKGPVKKTRARVQIVGAIGVVANPTAFLRDAGLKEAQRIVAETEKGRR
jgi:hypothetical protein